MSSEHIDRIAEVHRQIESVLLRDWDPIGVGEVPQAQDEYRDYVRGVYDVAVQTCSAEAVAKYLVNIERKTIGLSAWGFRPWKKRLPVAQKIIGLAAKL
jgi:hypothetical protein